MNRFMIHTIQPFAVHRTLCSNFFITDQNPSCVAYMCVNGRESGKCTVLVVIGNTSSLEPLLDGSHMNAQPGSLPPEPERG